MASAMISCIACAALPVRGFHAPVGVAGPLRRKIASARRGTTNVFRADAAGAPAALLLSMGASAGGLPQSKGTRLEVGKTLERGWAAQVAEGTLFPNKPRSAVAITACRVMEQGRTEWLLIQRGKAPNYGEWSLPGGSIELGEATLAAAKRELFEETQLCHPHVAFFDDSFMTSDAIVRDDKGTMLFHYVIAQMFAEIDADASVRAGDDAMDIGFYTIDEIKTQSFGKVTKNVLKVVQRASALHEAGLLSPPSSP